MADQKKLREFLSEQKVGAKLTLLIPGGEPKMTLEAARQYLSRLLVPAMGPGDLDRIKVFLESEIETRLHNNWMLIRAIEEYQTKEK